MKRIVVVACALLLTASVAYAGALADNDQFQGQFDGGFAAAGGGVAVGIGGAVGGQLGYGFSAATPGDVAAETQQQTQSQIDFVTSDDGNGNFSSHGWALTQNQESGSTSFGGVAGSAQAQGAVGGSAGLSIGGQFGVAGSAGFAAGGSGSGALGFAAAGNSQDQTFAGAYEQQSVGPNSYIYQSGQQEFGTESSSGAALIGVAGAGAAVGQAGGTVAANDGNAGYMEGHGTAAGNAVAGSASIGLAGAEASASGWQVHQYEQEAVSSDGSSYQGASGSVFTFVQAESN